MKLTPNQKIAKVAVNKLLVQAARLQDRSISGKSPAAAAKVTQANQILAEAGLLTGPLIT